MKKRLVFLLLIVAGQLAWLGVSYALRAREIAEAPRIVVACNPLDPRDLFRGDYMQLTLTASDGIDLKTLGSSLTLDDDIVSTLVSKLVDFDEETLPSPAEIIRPALRTARLLSLPGERAADATALREGVGEPKVASFWKQLGGTWELARLEREGSRQDRPREGEMRLAGASPTLDVCFIHPSDPAPSVYLGLSLPPTYSRWQRNTRFRYYVPEKTGNILKIWMDNYGNVPMRAYVRMSVELAVLPDGRCRPVQVYLNGIPYNRAVELMEKRQFPLENRPAPTGSSGNRG